MLVIIFLFHVVNNIIWLCFNEAGFVADSLNHFLFSLKLFDWIADGNFPYLTDMIAYIYPQYRWHGIFVGCLVAPFYFILGRSENSGAFVNGTIFLGVLIFSVYGICKKICEDKKTGVLAAFIVSMYPLIFTHSRTFELDLPLTAMVTLSVYTLMATDYFSRRAHSLLLGLVCGLGMLTKFNFLGFISAPFLLMSFKAQKKNRINIWISLFIILVVSLRFYILRFGEIFDRVYATSWFYGTSYYGNKLQNIPYAWLKIGIEYLFWFLRDCVENSVTFLFSIIFIIAIIPFVKSKVKYKAILGLWFLAPVLYLSFLFHKPVINRYIMPLLPVVAIISAMGIMRIGREKIKNMVLSILISLGCLQYAAISYKLDFLPEKIEITIPALKRITLFNRSINLVHRNQILPFSYPAPISWKEDEILDAIDKGRKNSGNIDIFFIDPVPEVYHSLISRVAIRKLPFSISFIPLADDYYSHRTEPLDFLSVADYVVIKKENPKSEIWQNRLYLKESVKNDINEARIKFHNYIDRFKLIKEINLPDPDGTVLLLYRKKHDYVRLSTINCVILFRDGLIKVIYDNGQVIPLNMCTKFQYSGKEYRGFQAEWNTEVQNNTFIAIGTYKDSPLILRYNIKLISNNNVDWEINMSSAGIVNLDSAELNINVVNPYRKWILLNNAREVQLKSYMAGYHYFPQISFKSLDGAGRFVFVSQQWRKREFKLLDSWSGNYLCYKGRIVFGE